MRRNNLSDTIITLLDKGYSREYILFYVSSIFARHIDIETIYKVYEITYIKWLKENKND